MCVYNGRKVSRAEYIRFKELEKELNNELDGSVGYGYDYSEWPIVRPTMEGNLDISMAKWGFVPDFVLTKDDLPKYRTEWDTIIARGENLTSSPLFWPAGQKLRRCIVLSTHYFEYQHYWERYKKKDGSIGDRIYKKVPYRVSLRNQEQIPTAGIWKPWTDRQTGETIDTFAIVTAPANPLLQVVHNSKKRMPTVLTEELAHVWLTKELTPQQITQLATFQMPAESFEAYTVSDDFRKGIDTNIEVTYPAFMILNTEFEVTYVSPKKETPAVMLAKLAFEGASVERWELHAGRWIFYFQNNRPELMRKRGSQAVKWWVINSKEFITRKSQVPDAVLFFGEVWRDIERESMGKKEVTFQDVRNKR